MKNIALASLILVAFTRLSLAGTDPAAQQLLVAAERQADLFNHDCSPFQLEVDFIAQMQVPTQGHLTYRWEASDRWWRKVSMGDFQQIDIRNGDLLYTSRNTPFTPMQMLNLFGLLNIGRSPDRWQVKKEKQRIEGGRAITCLQVRADTKESEAQLCVNPSSHEILSDEWKVEPDGSRRTEYSDYLEFGGHHYPRKFEHFENGIKTLTAQVVSLSTVPFDQALLVPPKGAIERRQCADMKRPIPVRTPDPLYPKSARDNGMMGDSMVSLTVYADGSVGDIRLIGSSTHSMDDATLETLKRWKFKPAMCGAEPVVADIQVVVSFRLH
jgi:periplasmic protein TonB